MEISYVSLKSDKYQRCGDQFCARLAEMVSKETEMIHFNFHNGVIRLIPSLFKHYSPELEFLAIQ